MKRFNELPKKWAVAGDGSSEMKHFITSQPHGDITGNRMGHNYYIDGRGEWYCYENGSAFGSDRTVLSFQEYLELLVIKAGQWVTVTDWGTAQADDWKKYSNTYQLRKDSINGCFYPVEDYKGGKNNGWGNASAIGIKFRLATQKEIEARTKIFIGYKCPFDFEYHKIKKGDIFILSTGDNGLLYKPQYGEYHFPKEIVETWEPVYEEEKIEIKGYKPEYKTGYVNFGCKTFTKDEILAIRKLLSETETKLTVEGTEITITLLNKLLTRC